MYFVSLMFDCCCVIVSYSLKKYHFHYQVFLKLQNLSLICSTFSSIIKFYKQAHSGNKSKLINFWELSIFWRTTYLFTELWGGLMTSKKIMRHDIKILWRKSCKISLKVCRLSYFVVPIICTNIGGIYRVRTLSYYRKIHFMAMCILNMAFYF